MKNSDHDHVVGIPMSSVTYEETHELRAGKQPLSPYLHSTTSTGSSEFKHNGVDSVLGWMNKFSRKADSFAQAILDHVSMGPKITEMVKGKLSLGKRILQAGGIQKAFRKSFSSAKGEKVLKAFQCYLSTTAGPISGLLFISTEKIAFHSERSLMLTSPKGGSTRVPYKVLIPLRRIRRLQLSENVNRPSQKYIEMVTFDDFEFWFMGFVNCHRSFKYLQRASSEMQRSYA